MSLREKSEQQKTIIGFDCTISHYLNNGTLEDERLDVYISASGDFDEENECDSFGVDDDTIFYYLGSDKLTEGNFNNEFYIHSLTPQYQ